MVMSASPKIESAAETSFPQDQEAISAMSAPSTAIFAPRDTSADGMAQPRQSIEQSNANADVSPPITFTSVNPGSEQPTSNGDKPSEEAQPVVKDVDVEDIDDDNDNLTPPPDSPSPVPSLPPANDEIVVGTKSSTAPPNEDIDMADVDEMPLSSHYPKRKRNSVYNSLNEDATDGSPSLAMAKLESSTSRFKGKEKVRGVTIGYWRDSDVPDKADKHQVIGFIDIRDRLRTRVQQTSRSGKIMTDKYPLPPGPGGSWVTFERIVFEDHLVNVDHDVIKEYVKIRQASWGVDEGEEEFQANNLAAVKDALAIVQAKPPPDSTQFVQPVIAYGEYIPDHAKVNKAHEKKKRRLNNAVAAAADWHQPAPSPDIVPRAHNRGAAKSGAFADDIPGSRPTKVIVGYWSKCSEPDVRDKHGVLGVLGANDNFRVKLAKATRDGRPVTSSFPAGPGGVWINYDEVVLEKHLQNLSRAEIKEYCRIRQSHMDAGEAYEDKIANETKAVHEAQLRVERGRNHGAVAVLPSPDLRKEQRPMETSNIDEGDSFDVEDVISEPRRLPERPARHIVQEDNYDDDDGSEEQNRTFSGYPQSQRPIRPTRTRHSLPGPSDLPAANRRPVPSHTDSSERLERVNSIARQHVARAEAHQSRIDQRQNSHGYGLGNGMNNGLGNGMGNGLGNGAVPQDVSREVKTAHFNEDMNRLNRVWQSQESHRMRSGTSSVNTDDVKMNDGIRYERKPNGPFPGKLTSKASIVTIDGEDYIEYRVLLKPSFN